MSLMLTQSQQNERAERLVRAACESTGVRVVVERTGSGGVVVRLRAPVGQVFALTGRAESFACWEPYHSGGPSLAWGAASVALNEGTQAAPDCACGPSHDCRATGCDEECEACCG